MKLSAPFYMYAKWAVGRQLKDVVILEGIEDYYGDRKILGKFAQKLLSKQLINLVEFTMESTSQRSYNTVVDVGAATGLFLSVINAKRKIGVNTYERCLAQLTKDGVESEKAVCENNPLPDNISDVTLCYETIEHVSSPSMLLTELVRITKPRGKILISIPWVRKTRYSHGEHIHEFDHDHFYRMLMALHPYGAEYKLLLNYRTISDRFTKWCIEKYLWDSYFPALQAYVLVKEDV